MNSNSNDHLNKCPLCVQVPGGKVFQCRRGHIFCEKCYSKLGDRCPRCRDSIEGNQRCRNLFMEATLDKLVFDCPFTQHGCKKKMKRWNMEDHRISCQYGKTIHLCQLLKLDDITSSAVGLCDHELNIVNVKDLKEHMEYAHWAEAIQCDQDFVWGCTLKSFFVKKKSVYSAYFNFGMSTHVLFVAKQQEDSVSWTILDMDNHGDFKDGEYKHVELWSDETPNISWNLPVFPVLDAENQIKRPVVVTSLTGLKKIRVTQEPNSRINRMWVLPYPRGSEGVIDVDHVGSDNNYVVYFRAVYKCENVKKG